MRTATYAVGDVHGRADLLEALLDHAAADAASMGAAPSFVFLGDVFDRGPRSRDAMEAVLSALETFPGSVLLRGNHDDMFLSAMTGGLEPRKVAAWLGQGGMPTLESYLPGDLEGAFEVVRTLHGAHLAAVASARPCVERDGFLFAHAGIDPSRPLSGQSDRDMMWIRQPFLSHVGLLEAPVVHGHSVVGDRPVVTENRISVDTGACASGRLTAAVIHAGEVRFIQTDGSARRVVAVEPVAVDRGMGTLLDRRPAAAAEPLLLAA